MKIGVVLLAGGQGTRMGSSLPKQFLVLKGQPVALHSFSLFEKIAAITEIVVVADPAYRDLFKTHKPLKFALPGLRRQDSVLHGLQALDPSTELVCVHDSARPFITVAMVEALLKEGGERGAACAAVPIKFTVKQASAEGCVERTLDRANLWEIQTPQVVRKDLLEKGFAIAQTQGLTVTDDVSLVELLDHPVQLVRGSYANLKITTPDDLHLAEIFACEI